jgi:hypothetical protein
MTKHSFPVMRISRDDIINALDNDAGQAAIARVNAMSDEQMEAVAEAIRQVLFASDFWYIGLRHMSLHGYCQSARQAPILRHST